MRIPVMATEYPRHRLPLAKQLLTKEICASSAAVGDYAQSICGFRAARVRNIIDFPKQVHPTRARDHAWAELPLDGSLFLQRRMPSSSQPAIKGLREDSDGDARGAARNPASLRSPMIRRWQTLSPKRFGTCATRAASSRTRPRRPRGRQPNLNPRPQLQIARDVSTTEHPVVTAKQQAASWRSRLQYCSCNPSPLTIEH